MGESDIVGAINNLQFTEVVGEECEISSPGEWNPRITSAREGF